MVLHFSCRAMEGEGIAQHSRLHIVEMKDLFEDFPIAFFSKSSFQGKSDSLSTLLNVTTEKTIIMEAEPQGIPSYPVESTLIGLYIIMILVNYSRKKPVFSNENTQSNWTFQFLDLLIFNWSYGNNELLRFVGFNCYTFNLEVDIILFCFV